MAADVFDCGAVLFQSDERDDEDLRIECAVTGEGELEIMQESDGPLTAWCFEETPHRIKAVVDREGVEGLMAYFHLEHAAQLPAILRLEYTGYTCFQRIREMLRHLEIPYRVLETAIVR